MIIINAYAVVDARTLTPPATPGDVEESGPSVPQSRRFELFDFLSSS